MACGQGPRSWEIQSREKAIFLDGRAVRFADGSNRLLDVVSYFGEQSDTHYDCTSCVGLHRDFCLFFVHLHLGTIGSPSSLQAMASGWVTRAWLRTHRAK